MTTRRRNSSIVPPTNTFKNELGSLKESPILIRNSSETPTKWDVLDFYKHPPRKDMSKYIEIMEKHMGRNYYNPKFNKEKFDDDFFDNTNAVLGETDNEKEAINNVGIRNEAETLENEYKAFMNS